MIRLSDVRGALGAKARIYDAENDAEDEEEALGLTGVQQPRESGADWGAASRQSVQPAARLLARLHGAVVGGSAVIMLAPLWIGAVAEWMLCVEHIGTQCELPLPLFLFFSAGFLSLAALALTVLLHRFLYGLWLRGYNGDHAYSSLQRAGAVLIFYCVIMLLWSLCGLVWAQVDANVCPQPLLDAVTAISYAHVGVGVGVATLSLCALLYVKVLPLLEALSLPRPPPMHPHLRNPAATSLPGLRAACACTRTADWSTLCRRMVWAWVWALLCAALVSVGVGLYLAFSGLRGFIAPQRWPHTVQIQYSH